MAIELGGGVTLRPATAEDATAIADLHAASWRTAYRGMIADAYLDGPLAGERRALWQARFARPDPRRIVVVAERDGGLAAFACLATGADPARGTLIDNLHARPGFTGRGLGGRVLAAALDRLSAAEREAPIHLTVLGANARARAVYAAWGGRDEGLVDDPGPDGSHPAVHRVAWTSAAVLAARVGRRS